MTEKTLNEWGDFTGANFLKSTNVAGENEAFIVKEIEIFQDEDNVAKPRLVLKRGTDEFLFDLNVTNANFCKSAGVPSPKDLVGRMLYFKKVLVNSPKTKKEVESLRICKVQ